MTAKLKPRIESAHVSSVILGLTLFSTQHRIIRNGEQLHPYATVHKPDQTTKSARKLKANLRFLRDLAQQGHLCSYVHVLVLALLQHQLRPLLSCLPSA